MRAWLLALVAIFGIACQHTPMTSQTQTSPPDQGEVADAAEAVEPIAKGQQAPSAMMRTVEGRPIEVKTLYRKQPTVLVFYRGGWCPYCNTQLSDLAKVKDKLAQMGFQTVAVSMDRPAKLRQTLDKQTLDYTLLSDADAELTKAFGLAFRVDPSTVKRYTSMGIDLEAASGHDHHILPVPAVYLIDTNGQVRYAYWNADYKQRLSGEALLEAASGFAQMKTGE
jgi:peroxiredoxin